MRHTNKQTNRKKCVRRRFSEWCCFASRCRCFGFGTFHRDNAVKLVGSLWPTCTEGDLKGLEGDKALQGGWNWTKRGEKRTTKSGWLHLIVRERDGHSIQTPKYFFIYKTVLSSKNRLNKRIYLSLAGLTFKILAVATLFVQRSNGWFFR